MKNRAVAGFSVSDGGAAGDGISSRQPSKNSTRRKRKVRAFLLSRFSLIRRVLKLLLELDRTIEVVGDADTAQECVAQMDTLHPDIIVIEILERGAGDLDVLTEVRPGRPQAPVLMITADFSQEGCLHALRRRVAGLLPISVEPEHLRAAVRAVCAGGTVIHHALTQVLVARSASAHAVPQSVALTPREMDIIRGLTEGFSDKQIAMQLSLAPNTVKIHLRAMYKKLGLHNRAQAAVYAAAHGLLGGGPPGTGRREGPAAPPMPTVQAP